MTFRTLAYSLCAVALAAACSPSDSTRATDASTDTSNLADSLADSAHQDSMTSSTDAPADGADAGSLSTAMSAFAAAECSYLQRCFPFIYEAFTSESQCETNYLTDITPQYSQPGVTVAELGQIAAYYNSKVCYTTPAVEVFTGSLANGQPCSTRYQCASGHCTTEGTCGICAPAAVAGAACVQNADCEPANVCIDLVCQAPAAAGAGCLLTSQCATGFCSGTDICMTYATVGESCASVGCEPSLVCDRGDTNTCLSTPPIFEAANLACDNNLTWCQPGLTCSLERACAPGTMEGQPCQDADQCFFYSCMTGDAGVGTCWLPGTTYSTCN